MSKSPEICLQNSETRIPILKGLRFVLYTIFPKKKKKHCCYTKRKKVVDLYFLMFLNKIIQSYRYDVEMIK